MFTALREYERHDTTVNTAEYGRIRVSTCPLERGLEYFRF